MATVVEEDVCSASDEALIAVCRAEGRTLVSLDKDFTSILRFPPARYTGIVVLRLREPVRLEAIENALHRFLAASTATNLAGKLWIIDAHRIREFEGPESQ